MRGKNSSISFFIIFLIAAFAAGYARSENTITILVENDAPYSCPPESRQAGFVQDILRTVFEKKGYRPVFKIVPWLRSLNAFNSQNSGVDCMIGMKVHPVKKDLALFPEEEVARYTHRFYALKDSPTAKSWKYEGTNSLKGLKLGCVKGWNYCDKEITKYLAEGSSPAVQAMTGEDAEEKNFKKLLSGRIDLWVANINNSEYMLGLKCKAGINGEDKVVGISDLPVTTEVNVYPIFYNDEKGKKYSEIFTKGIRELRKSGELKKILAKYGLKDWK